MRGLRFGLLALLVGSTVVACDSTPLERTQSSCTVICGCLGPPIPSQQEECVEECVNDVLGNGIGFPEECSQCIGAHARACSTLIVDCEPVCDQTDPPPPPIDDEPVPGVDAGMPLPP